MRSMCRFGRVVAGRGVKVVGVGGGGGRLNLSTGLNTPSSEGLGRGPPEVLGEGGKVGSRASISFKAKLIRNITLLGSSAPAKGGLQGRSSIIEGSVLDLDLWGWEWWGMVGEGGSRRVKKGDNKCDENSNEINVSFWKGCGREGS